MNSLASSIVPITEARTKLGDLAEQVSKKDFVVLTKGGIPKAALVDISYLQKLIAEVKKIYSRTYIDPKLLPFTREFADSEIAEWLKTDKI